MAAAYATVADGGVYHAPTFVSKVVDRSGAVIYNGESEGKRVFSDQIADEAIIALRATVQYGTGTAAALPNAEVAGKTGTTENSVDAWFNGITPTLVSSVWIGDPKGEMPMYVNGEEVFGADYPTQIWHDVMAYGLKDVPYTAFPPPDPSLMAPVKYIDSDSLARDDLLSHGGLLRTTCVASGSVNPCPTTTTRATTTTRPRPRPTTTVRRPAATTTSVFVLPPPPTGDLTPATTLVPATTALRVTTTLPVTTAAPVTTTLPPTTPAPVTSAPPITPATTSPPPVTRPHHQTKKVPVTTLPPVTALPPVTTALPVTTTSLVTPPMPHAAGRDDGADGAGHDFGPADYEPGGLRAARADIELRPPAGTTPAGRARRRSGKARRRRAKHAGR